MQRRLEKLPTTSSRLFGQHNVKGSEAGKLVGFAASAFFGILTRIRFCAPFFDRVSFMGEIVPFTRPVAAGTNAVSPEQAIFDLAEAASLFSVALATFEERIQIQPDREARLLMNEAWKRLAESLSRAPRPE